MKVALLRVGSIVRVGLSAIGRNKMRSALTVLGIIIGVACVIAMVSVATGASNAVQSSINSLGSNFLMIFPGATTQSGARLFTGNSALTEDDALAIKNECTACAYVSPGNRTSAQIVAGELNWGTSIYGAGVEWPLVRAWNVAEGSFFTEPDVKGSMKVAVLGATVAEKLFPDGGAIGQTIRIKNVPFRVIGVLEKKGSTQMGDQDDTVIAPYTTVMKRLEGRNRLGNILVGAVSPDMVGEAQAQIEALLRQRHRIPPGGDADFMIRTQNEIASMAAQSTKTFSVLLGSVAAISLLVGGIGIMNIMLVSVTERTREIGIRLAVGAKARHVLAQFLIEAVVLSVVGGAIGVGVGMAASRILAQSLGWAVSIGPGPILMAFGVSALIGIFFGFYPARKASRLDPIEALRYE